MSWDSLLKISMRILKNNLCNARTLAFAVSTTFVAIFLWTQYGRIIPWHLDPRRLSSLTPSDPEALFSDPPTIPPTSMPWNTSEWTESKFCKPGKVELIFYNRVPKTGSTTVLSVFKKLQRQGSRLKCVSSPLYNHRRLSDAGRKSLIKNLKLHGDPRKSLIYDRHVYFVNFTRYELPMPVYINTFREPVERLVSGYYFNRLRGMTAHGKAERTRKSKITHHRTFEDCVKRRLPFCLGSNHTNILVNFFCGQDAICTVPSNEALQLAKKNVEQFYTLVGPMNDLKGFFTILEILMPHVFEGAVATYDRYFSSGTKQTYDHPQYVFPPVHVVRILNEEYLQFERELYLFLQQRYYTLKTMAMGFKCL